MQTETSSSLFDNVSTKLVAAGVIVVCLLLGFAGLILPLIPGLLFLAIAALVAAKFSPRFAETLRERNSRTSVRNALCSGESSMAKFMEKPCL